MYVGLVLFVYLFKVEEVVLWGRCVCVWGWSGVGGGVYVCVCVCVCD